jgi:hypothetical protein
MADGIFWRKGGELMAKSSAERNAVFRNKQSGKGLVRKCVWVPDTLEANQELKELEKKLQEKG